MLSVSSVRGFVLGMAGVVLASTAQAQSMSDIQFWVGTGANQAAFVIDWNDGKNPQSLVWGYRWDGTATGEDMFHAIVAADSRLFAHVSAPFGGGLGTALFGLGYDLNNDGIFGVSPTLTFDSGGYSVGAPGDGRVATDAADHWQEGWFSDGYWSYWLGGNDATPAWDYSGVGMSSRVLVNGSWDGWSYAPGFNGDAPSMPVPASVPAPGVLAMIGAGGIFASRRRRGRKALTAAAPLAAVAAVGAMTGAASAQYRYDPNDFAVEVVSSTGFPSTPGLYTDPSSVLGGPATRFYDVFGGGDSPRVKLIEPAYNTAAPGGQRLITTFNAGQSVTVRMGRTVYDDPNNPFGIDLNVFGNSFFAVTGGTPGGFVSDATNLNNVTVGGVFSEPVRVSVSPDNINWYTFMSRTGDGLMPTNAYAWDAANAIWTNNLLDPTKPVDPALSLMNFSGMTAASVLALYNGSAGGTGFDIAESGFAFINYVRFDGIAGFSGGEIDAVAAVRAVPTPGSLTVIALGGITAMRRRR